MIAAAAATCVLGAMPVAQLFKGAILASKPRAIGQMQGQTQAGKMIPRETLGLAAEFAVASELCRRGLYAQLTLGNKKRTDLIVHDDETDKLLRIEVKAKQGTEWPNCKGIYKENVMLVFVDYKNKKEDERPDFFVLTVEDWVELVNKVVEERPNECCVNKYNVLVWKNQVMKNGRYYEGVGVKVDMIKTYDHVARISRRTQ